MMIIIIIIIILVRSVVDLFLCCSLKQVSCKSCFQTLKPLRQGFSSKLLKLLRNRFDIFGNTLNLLCVFLFFLQLDKEIDTCISWELTYNYVGSVKTKKATYPAQ